jgi:hypothetical protein
LQKFIFFVIFWRNFVSTLQQDLIGYSIRGGGGGGVYYWTPRKFGKYSQFRAGLRPSLVPLSNALTYNYSKDYRIAFSSRKLSFFVRVVTIIDEIGEKSHRKYGPTFVNRNY